MEVEYFLTVQDMEAFARYHIKKDCKSAVKPRQWVTWIAGGMVLLLLLSSLSSNDAKQRGFAWFVLGAVVGGNAVFALLVWTRKLAINSLKALYADEHSRWLFTPRRLKINPESIAIISDYQQTIQKRSVIWKIAVTDEHLFLYESMNSAMIIPRRAFRDEEQFEEFVALARQYQRENDRQPTRPTGIIASLPPPSDAMRAQDIP